MSSRCRGDRRAGEFAAVVGERPLIAVCERAALVRAVAAVEGRRFGVRRGLNNRIVMP